MKLKIPGVALSLLMLNIVLTGQPASYTVKKAGFSSDKYDEFAPVYYKNGIVFSTNRNQSVISYSNDQNKGLFKIAFIDTAGVVIWQNAKILSKDLTSRLNDGPAAFTSGKDTIVFSRNLEITKNLHDVSAPRNKLGVFISSYDGKKWSRIKEFRINNEWYNVTTPFISHDGKMLYFASDKPDGYGGMDLYVSQFKDGYWADPINLGPEINTAGNELYPFIAATGELFFSSDGRKGLGGKDIYFSRVEDGKWVTPVLLDAPVNSDKDDFGIITDSLLQKGYFSSNRDGSFDIFKFNTKIQQVFYTSQQKENQHCFSFSDTGSIDVDTVRLSWLWDFGDGTKAAGRQAHHCFPGPGKYKVSLNLMDRNTGNKFFTKLSYTADLKDFEQPYISSPRVTVQSDSIGFDGSNSYLPGYKILSYTWNFGDGTIATGQKVYHTYSAVGEYSVNLGLTIRSDATGKTRKTGVSKTITVVETQSAKDGLLASSGTQNSSFPEITQFINAKIEDFYSAEKDLADVATFDLDLLSSDVRLGVDEAVFAKLPPNYRISESYDSITHKYRYSVASEMTLMDTYLTYSEIAGKGFPGLTVRTSVITDQAAKDLYTVSKIFGLSTDVYFDSRNRLTSSGYLMLDQVLRIMDRNPGKVLSIEVFTDNAGSPEEKKELSVKLAKTVYTYMMNKGVDAARLSYEGFGSTRPVVPNLSPEGRAANRRMILKFK